MSLRAADTVDVAIDPAVNPPVELPADDSGLEFLRAFLDDFSTLRAAFRQEVINRDLELVEASSGQVTLEKPGRFRWDYAKPFERTIVADGERVWLFEADLDQVSVRRLSAGIGETPAALLTGQAEVLDRFEYRGSETVNGLKWISLRPQSAESDFDTIKLGFDANKLVQFELQDRLGQLTRLQLSDIELNIDIAEDVFRFEIPEGVDVIGETEL